MHSQTKSIPFGRVVGERRQYRSNPGRPPKHDAGLTDLSGTVNEVSSGQNAVVRASSFKSSEDGRLSTLKYTSASCEPPLGPARCMFSPTKNLRKSLG